MDFIIIIISVCIAIELQERRQKKRDEDIEFKKALDLFFALAESDKVQNVRKKR